MADSAMVNQPKAENESRPYTPSWLDRFNDALNRLPGPSWLHYLGIGSVLVLLQIVVLWREGTYSVEGFLANHAFIAGLIPFLLALSQFLDNRAVTAFAALRPVLSISEEKCQRLEYQLTTLPARSTLLVSLFGVASIVFLNIVTDSLSCLVS